MCVRVCWLFTAESKGTVAYNPDTKGLEPSTTQSWNSGGTAGELVAERAKASFEVRRRCLSVGVLVWRRALSRLGLSACVVESEDASLLLW